MFRNFACMRCGTGPHKASINGICQPCSYKRADESRAATRRVVALIRAGAIKKAKEHACVDCGKPALDYDHSDYLKPTEVEPVCRGCNQRRGPALDSVMRSISRPEAFTRKAT